MGRRAGNPYLVRLKHWERQQLVGRGRRQSRVLVACQGTQAVAGLRRDDDTSAAAGDDVPELL
jgi:hypothetical protein